MTWLVWSDVPPAAMLGIAYFLAVNVIALICYIVDKARAARGASRIPEGTLLGLALVGGSLGALIGMLAVRHKTRKWYFMVTVPLLLIAQIVLVAYVVVVGVA